MVFESLPVSFFAYYVSWKDNSQDDSLIDPRGFSHVTSDCVRLGSRSTDAGVRLCCAFTALKPQC